MKLQEIQAWFGKVVMQKFEEDHQLRALPDASIIKECSRLSSLNRMQIYHAGYWLRLLDALHDEYPLVTALFGTDNFDMQIGVPYLMKYPSSHWSLHMLGRYLPCWIEESYQGDDKKLIHTTASLDWACQQSFFAKSAPSLDLHLYQGRDAEKLLTLPLKLQTHVHLFECDANFMPFRDEILKEKPDHWLDHDFPKLERKKTYYFIIFRNSSYVIKWDDLHATEHKLLTLLQGLTLEEAIDRLQDVDQTHLEEEIAFWVQKWLLFGWITVAAKN